MLVYMMAVNNLQNNLQLAETTYSYKTANAKVSQNDPSDSRIFQVF